MTAGEAPKPGTAPATGGKGKGKGKKGDPDYVKPSDVVKVQYVKPGGTEISLSEMEWASMERALEAETRVTHLNLQRWLFDRAQKLGLRNANEQLGGHTGEEDDGPSDDEDEKAGDKKDFSPKSRVAGKGKDTTEEDVKVDNTVEEKNWSTVK